MNQWTDCRAGGGLFELDWNDSDTATTTRCIGGDLDGVTCLNTASEAGCNALVETPVSTTRPAIDLPVTPLHGGKIEHPG